MKQEEIEDEEPHHNDTREPVANKSVTGQKQLRCFIPANRNNLCQIILFLSLHPFIYIYKRPNS